MKMITKLDTWNKEIARPHRIIELPCAGCIGPQVLMAIVKAIMDMHAPAYDWKIETKVQ
jgi:hypothetical protein